jgi:voltage-gated potassium channel
MQTTAAPKRPRSNTYELFILVLTVYSLILMVVMLLPIDDDTYSLVNTYDNLICVVFLIDFFTNLFRAPTKREYFIDQRGWLDLLGSVPSFGFFRYTGLLRLARLSRLARITRLMRSKHKTSLVEDIVQNRGQYAIFITLLSAMIVLSTASILVLQFEARSPGANITTGGDALWWGLVTITTVGYGDYFPVTPMGRITGIIVMFAGVGIIGALASILASILIPPPKESAPEEQPIAPASPMGAAVEEELAAIKRELEAVHRLLAGGGQRPPPEGG